MHHIIYNTPYNIKPYNIYIYYKTNYVYCFITKQTMCFLK